MDNVESNSLSSRSSSLITFESLEKHCEDILVSASSADPPGFNIPPEPLRWTVSPDSPRESLDEFDSSDEEHGFNSSVDTLHRSHSLRENFRSRNDTRLRSYRSFDSLNFFETLSPLSYTLQELSQSHSALDFEKEKQREQEFVIRDKKLTATTADLSTMTDPYDTRLKGLGCRSRKRKDIASYHYKEPNQYRNFKSAYSEENKGKRNHFPSKRKSYSAEGLKVQLSSIDENSKCDADKNHGRSDPCLNVPSKSLHSVENLSEDSGFDDQISSKSKTNKINFRTSVLSIPEDGDASPSESSSSNFSDCNGSEEGSVVFTEGREQCKKLNKNIGSSSKITEIQEPEVRGNDGLIQNDADVKFNSGQNQTHMFSCSADEEGLFKRGEIEKLVSTSSVPFASLVSNEIEDSVRSCSNNNNNKKSEFNALETGKNSNFFNGPERHLGNQYFLKEDLTVCKSLDDFAFENMSSNLDKYSVDNNNRAKTSRLPVLSTPNLLSEVDDVLGRIPSASSSSLTHVPLKCFDEDDIDGRVIKNKFVDIKKTNLNSELMKGSQISGSIKGVHFCPVVSEVSWQDNYSSEVSSTASSSDPSTDEISNRSFEELRDMENDDEEFHEIEEKLIPRDRHVMCNAQRNSLQDDLSEVTIIKFKSVSEQNLSTIDKSMTANKGSCPSQRKNNSVKSSGNPVTVERLNKDGMIFNVNISPNECEPCIEEKPVTPTICVTPTSSGHVFVSDAAQSNAERRTRLSVSESNLPTQDHGNDETSYNRAHLDHIVASGKDTTTTMKKSKSRFGGFFERFSLRRLSNRKASGGNGKKPNGKKEDKKDKDGHFAATASNGGMHEDVMIIPLHGPDNEANVKEVFRSVVTPHVVSSKPPLPPNFQRMSGNTRKHFPSGIMPVGLQNEGTEGKENMPGVPECLTTDNNDSTEGLLNSNADPKQIDRNKPVGLLETDLDTHITVESISGRRPLLQSNVGNNKKARSLMNLGLGDMMSVRENQEENLPSGYLEPPTHRSHGSVAVDDRAKSMEFLLDKENQAAILVSTKKTLYFVNKKKNFK